MAKKADSLKLKPEAFLERVRTQQAVVGVVGMGYVGLPLALEFAESGFKVIGFDIDPAKTKSLKQGRTYIKHIPSERISSAVGSGKFEGTTDFARVAGTDAVIICVPTPLDRHRDPDMSYIEATGRSIAPHLRKGMLISLESTTWPGTTEELLAPILEKGSGLKAGRDFYLAFSPEREDPSNPDFNTKSTPKIVGGIDKNSLRVADALYSAVVNQTVPVSSAAVAEASKLLENIFRSVNIALVNEMKIVLDRMGIDVWEVIRAASTKPFGFMPFYPGPGLGGHCIPIDPFYLTWRAKEFDVTSKFIELAGEINSAMPEYVVAKTIAALNEAGKAISLARILIVGAAYKPNVDDLRESPALNIIARCEALGAKVDYHDPYIPVIRRTRHYPSLAGRKSTPLDDLHSYDAVIIVTWHKILDPQPFLDADTIIVDTRNAMSGLSGRARIVKA